MDSLTGKLGVLPGKQQKDSFGLGENGWCDKPRILKYMYSCGGHKIRCDKIKLKDQAISTVIWVALLVPIFQGAH